jgi:AcrR family transcriptional regulator
LSSVDRRDQILAAATAVFADRGFSGATTQQIAKAAGVSEPLLYRHFPSKLALHKAVLRKAILEQDTVYSVLGETEASARGLLQMLSGYLGYCLYASSNAVLAAGQRLLLASLAGNGEYAQLLYKRAVRLSLSSLEEAIDAARASGDLTGEKLVVQNMLSFVEHVGAQMLNMQLSGVAPTVYSGSRSELLRQAVQFCARGLGLTDEAIQRYYVAPDTSHYSGGFEAAVQAKPSHVEPIKKVRTKRTTASK